jgi:hypothetical protein
MTLRAEADRPKAATMTAVAESRRGGAMGPHEASRHQSAREMTRIMVGNPDRTQRIEC